MNQKTTGSQIKKRSPRGAQASWTTLVAAELVGAVLGLGKVLSTAYRDIYAAMIAVGMITVALWARLRPTCWI